MKTNNLLRKIGGLLLVGLLLPGLALFSSNQTVQAQRRIVIVRPVRPFRPFRSFGYRYGYSPYSSYSYYNQYVFSNGEAAENQGYHDGLKTGSDDGRKGKSYNPERSHYFHDSGFGNFAEAYRNGFLRGYENGYRA